MLVIYRDGEIQNQVVAWGGDRERRLEGKSGCGNSPTKVTPLTHCPRTGGRAGPVWCDYTYDPSWR
jgi:hypothetical protein